MGWSKCGLLRLFGPEFQKDVMIQNMKSHLFKEDTSIQVDTNKNIEDEDIGVEESCTTTQIWLWEPTNTKNSGLAGFCAKSGYFRVILVSSRDSVKYRW
jgi:hypothetical protein